MTRPTACALALVLVGGGLNGCATGPIENPVSTLGTPSLMGKQHQKAIGLIAELPVDDEEANRALERAMSNPGYTVPVREAALNTLAERDLARAKRALRNNLPNTTLWAWLERASAIIAERQWVDLTPALVSSWSRPASMESDELKRPEYLALAKLHGPDRVTDLVFETFLASRSVAEQGLRTRCWTLLNRLGQRDRLVALVNSADIPADDVFLLDLQAASRDLGLVPHNREEILWLRKLRQPEHASFWSQSREATSSLDPAMRAQLEIRDLPVVVSAYLHQPELLSQSTDELYRRVESALKGRKHYAQQSNFEGFSGFDSERLYTHRNKYTWGDLAAILIALRAMDVPEVVEHLFDYADRDRADETTEYGGVIALDERNRFEVQEFEPVIREHDQKFIASQKMLDSAYTAIFHFHFHVQKPRNDRYAGPGYGDMNYADNTRANCLVFTSVGSREMNVDYYRHGRVVVDLGTIVRSER